MRTETPDQTDDQAPPTDTPEAPGAIVRCACGVPRGTAHYCAAQDHNWIKAPDPLDLERPS